MTKKMVVLSNITGEELKEGEYLEVQIEKPGYLHDLYSWLLSISICVSLRLHASQDVAVRLIAL